MSGGRTESVASRTRPHAGRRVPAGLVLVLLALPACALVDPHDDEAPAASAVPFVAQKHRQGCLVAASAMAMGAVGVHASYDELWDEVRAWQEGTTVFEIAAAAERRGLVALAFRSDEAELARLVDAGLAPIAIVGWPQKHAIVVAGRSADAGTWRLHDPKTEGPADLGAAAFAERWAATGHELVVIARAPVLARHGLDVDRLVATMDEGRELERRLQQAVDGR